MEFLKFDINKCVLCGVCVEKCPFGALTIEGNGIVVLKVPVPESEIFKCILINDTLKVDGNFAIFKMAGGFIKLIIT